MGIKKVQFIPGRKLDADVKKHYNIKDEEYAKITVVNPDKGMKLEKVTSPVREVREVFKKKSIRLKLE